MAMSFLKVYYDFEERTEGLSDSEKGRLLLAMLRYASTKQTQLLSGNERFVFPSFKKDIDRDLETYTTKAENGSKGGTASSKIKQTEAKQQQPQAAASSASNSYSYSSSCCGSSYYSSSSSSQETPKNGETTENGSFLTDEEALKLSELHEQLYQAARRAKLPDGEDCIADAAELVREYGEEAVFKAMKKAARVKPIWPYVEGILRNEKAGGRAQKRRPEIEIPGEVIL